MSILSLMLTALLGAPLVGGEPAEDALVVSGTVYEASGAPASGVRVYAYPMKEGTLRWGLSRLEDGTLAPSSPVAATDSKGRFRLTVPRWRLREHETEEFALGTFKAGPRLLKEESSGATLVLGPSAFKDGSALDLDQLFDRIVTE